MLNTHKLLYILPDLAYVAELLPAKKPNTFAIQSFRQINGQFLDDNEFIATNVLKLFSKLDADEYHLILPDFLFTNTIVSIKETGDARVKKYLKDHLLPDLSLDTNSHEIETFILTEFKGESKVQLSAIEKSVLTPLRVGAHRAQVKISAISPVSWAIKSVVSLEPSISILQIGDTLYSALQYIGLDQTTQAPVAEIEAIAETIKTLKGAEPNIQTIYLLSNTLVEQRLKELVSDTLPIQQLNSLREDEAQMPSYVKDIIEFSMRTLSLTDYQVPNFSLGKPTPTELDSFDQSQPAATEETEASPEPDLDDSSEETEEVAPAELAPTEPDVAAQPEATPELELTSTIDALESINETTLETKLDLDTEDTPETDALVEADTEKNTDDVVDAEDEVDTDEVDLSRFVAGGHAVSTQAPTDQTTHKSADHSQTPSNSDHSKESQIAKPQTPKHVIKNSSGVAPMLKMVFITLAVFAVTVAVGIGVGLGLLQLSSKNNAQTSPVVVTQPSPLPTSSPVPSMSPKPALDKTAVSILIVNATTKAGYAGTIKTLLEKDGFTTIATGNAKGEYAANTLLLDEDNEELTSAIQTAADLDDLVDYASDSAHPKTTEDPTGKYDAVLIMAK